MIDENTKTMRLQEWALECHKYRGRVLIGEKSHYCHDWDGLPVDETTTEFDYCSCFKTLSQVGEEIQQWPQRH